MPLGMLARPVARGIEQRRRRVLAAERPVVADVSPDAASFGLAFRQDRNRGVIAVQALSRQNVAFDQRVQGPQGGGAGADLVSERRQAQLHAFASVTLALAIQRLMLAKLLEQDHRQQIEGPRSRAA